MTVPLRSGDDGVPRTPGAIFNRPGLSSLSCRVGVHGAFKATLLANLAAQTGLHVGEDGDFSVALADAFSVMADTLTFYQERIANEAYLRTATERRSTLELARLIDYSPRPGVAASAYLAFTLEDAPGAPKQAAAPLDLPARLKVQSLPDPGQMPQTFETVEEIEARPEWNAIKPLSLRPQTVSADMETVLLSGVGVDVKPGDAVLIAAESNDVKRVGAVARDAANGVTRIDLSVDPPDPPPYVPPIYDPGFFFAGWPLLDNVLVDRGLYGRTFAQHDVEAMARINRWSLPRLRKCLRRHVAAHRAVPVETGVFVFRQRAALFGHNAPKYLALPSEQRAAGGAYPTPWGDNVATLADQPGDRDIYLDRVYPNIVPGSWVVLETQYLRKLCRVEEVGELSRADYALAGKTTRLRLDSDGNFADFSLRETAVLLQSEPLVLADLPIDDPVEGSSVILDEAYFGLEIGRTVILSGPRADLDGVDDSEALTIADIELSGGVTHLSFVQALQHSYVRAGVTINANVALATHGETVREILGSGDSSRPYQRLPLGQPPLTHVGSEDPSGAASTLELRVNDLAWTEVRSFLGAAPTDRVYVARTGDDGRTTVEFGDGVAGARPPTGQENIEAVYRKGGGAAGNVAADKLTLLPNRPLGVRSVTNPLAASGATGAEGVEDIRANAALTVHTLDRIVSLQDYEDFARAFAGVAKAEARWIWSGHRRHVLVTVAGPDGAEVRTGSRTGANLVAAMAKASPPGEAATALSFSPAFFRVAATVFVESGATAGNVVEAAGAALRDAFSFAARGFGQPVSLGEVLAVLQRVEHVRAARVDALFRSDDPAAGIADWLPAHGPGRDVDGQPTGAELLTLDPRPIDIKGEPA